MAIYYLDVDDEITSAAARIRDSSDSRIALVLSSGSRVATSRINFRLLANEARHRDKRLAIIAADPSVQSVARTAELPVYASVGDYEKAEATLARSLGGGPAAPTTRALDELALTVGPPTLPGRAGATGVSRIPGGPPAAHAARRGSRVPRFALLGAALLVAAIVAVGGFFFYPSATVVLTLSEVAVGPTTVSVKVDPSVTASNLQAGTVPGLTKDFPVSASGDFEATGQNIVDTAAAGTVTFTSEDTGRAWAIPAGTQLSTADGTKFLTNARVVVPAAVFSPPKRGTIDAAVTAATKGVAGNVAASQIVVMPDISGNGLLSVTNKAATAGGTHTVTPKIQQSDVDKAQTSLYAQMQASFDTALKAPSALPSGSTLFADSARLGTGICDQDPQAFVDQDVASFHLDCKATGTAIVTSVAAITDLAKARLRATVQTGYSLVEDSIAARMGSGTAEGSSFLVPVSVQAVQVPAVDIDQLRAGIKGKSIDDARAFLTQYGQVEISVSPDWATTLPSFDFRIDIQLVVPSAAPSSEPSVGSSESPTLGATAKQADGGGAASPSSAATAPPGSSGASSTPGPTNSPSPTPSTTPSGQPSPSSVAG
jgi:hypothetical protein